MFYTLRSFLSQSFLIPSPKLTEQNIPSQQGRVFFVTGGYAGIGKELSAILYSAGATVWLAARSQAKADKAIRELCDKFPASRGALHFLPIDLSDLTSIAPAVQKFKEQSSRLDVLVNNAGFYDKSGTVQKSIQGYEIDMATNCLGSFLLSKLLMPILKATAANSKPGSVRVTWAGSLAIDLASPLGGMAFEKGEGSSPPAPKINRGPDFAWANYAQSKAGNLLLATAWAERHGREDGVIHKCFNPGNLMTDQESTPSFGERLLIRLVAFPARFGAYTELYTALSPEIADQEKSGVYLAPWGRQHTLRPDIEQTLNEAKMGTGLAHQFLDWCEQTTAPYATAGGKMEVPFKQ